MAPPVAEQPPAELGVLPAVAPSAADLQQVLPEQTKIPGPPPTEVDRVKKLFPRCSLHFKPDKSTFRIAQPRQN